jgi:Rho termination factor, N-terminal domain
MELVAIKTFSRGGAELTRLGTVFTANDKHAEEYIRLKLAEPVKAEDQKAAAQLNTVGETAPAAEAPKTDYTEEELNAKNLTDLRKIAKDNGVTGYTAMNKAEVVAAILTKQLEA